jgi:hypothetical protein
MKNMKLKTIGIIATFLAFGLYGQEAKITVHVTDESGLAISNAQISAGFSFAPKGSGGWGASGENHVNGVTDSNGICAITGNGNGGDVGISIVKEGYYGTTGFGVIFTNLDFILHRWQPWNPTIEVVLQKRGVQVPMYARRVDEIKIPGGDKPVGFDLEIGDWVAPYGKGETADFLFKYESKPEPTVPVREIPPYDVTLTVSFSNDGDGIQSVFVPTRGGHSGLRLPRQAPADGYEPVLIKHEAKERGQKAYSDFRDDQNYFFRVRTKKDARGNIVSALYGKIYGDFNHAAAGGKLTFTYYLNPEPNSLNMEFDPKQNLFKNLEPMEQVSAP